MGSRVVMVDWWGKTASGVARNLELCLMLEAGPTGEVRVVNRLSRLVA
jgi:hypothetical protein